MQGTARQLCLDARNDHFFLSMLQALVTALLDLPAMMAIAGLPCNVTVRRVSPVAGFTMPWQVPHMLVLHLSCCQATGDPGGCSP